MALSRAILDSAIAATEVAIAAAQASELALLQGAVSSYTLDTGQTRQTVTKTNSTEFRNYLDSLYNRLSMLCVRRDGGGTRYVAPSF